MNRPGENKPPLHLLPDVLELVATVLGDGAEKHGDFGWRELDLPPVEWINSADRHMLEYKRGGRADHDSGHHPLAHAIADLMIALEKDLQGDDLSEIERWIAANCRCVQTGQPLKLMPWQLAWWRRSK